ncbi:hypothetical protein AVEN_235172-1 [Araneus ventricosus]|uniref:Ig-like domain-containing protein n=1 Tax=Araneus ventricosus TaxID=182803 RepID=A0A4Y2JEN7_ARAVE|nr:hypothetical protein AVEN_235172-1 [Araneus ventricosus]
MRITACFNRNPSQYRSRIPVVWTLMNCAWWSHYLSPRLPDLSPLDFFFVGDLKTIVHETVDSDVLGGTITIVAAMISIKSDSPVCVPGQKILYGATRHEEVKVVCEVDADPTDVSFHWSFNKSGENMEDVPFVSEGTRSTATVTAKTDYDYGTLTCTGSNSVGLQKEPCVYTVITAVISEPSLPSKEYRTLPHASVPDAITARMHLGQNFP